jgi:carbonic anhydrase/acetyltransferase-like protein (isoleucine patch superfamily)
MKGEIYAGELKGSGTVLRVLDGRFLVRGEILGDPMEEKLLYAFDGREPEIGRDVYISDQAVVIGDVKIGDGCYVGPGAILRGDYGRIEIGPGTAVEENVTIHAPPGRVCQVGKKVTLGHGAVIHAGIVGDLAVVGMGAVLSLGVKVGERAIVAEGAVVRMNQKVSAGVIIAGNPGKVIRNVTPEDEQRWKEGKQLYIDLAKKYLKIGLQPISKRDSRVLRTSEGRALGKSKPR